MLVSSADVTPNSSSHSGAPGPGDAWRLRFWAVFAGQGSSLVGSAMTQFVLLWWIADTTGSVSALATAGIFALLPQALLGPLGGTLADRYSRRLLMIVPDLVSALCMVVLIALFLADGVELWHLYGMMFVRSAMQAFQAPAAAATTAMLVPPNFLPRAAGLNQTLAGIATVAAAPLGALAIALMPIGWALAIDVVTALLAVVPLLVFAIPQPEVPRERREGLWREFEEGVRVVWGSPGLLRLYGLLAAVTLVVVPSFALVPLLVKAHFGGGAAEVALVEGLGGAGMIVGGLVVAALAPTRRILWVVLGFAASCLTLALVALAPADMLWLAVAWWTLGCVGFVMGNAPLMTIVQTTVPNRLQGRVLSLLNTVMALAAPVGLALATPLGEAIGVRWLFVAVGVAGCLVSLLGLLSPKLLRIESADPAGIAPPPARQTPSERRVPDVGEPVRVPVPSGRHVSTLEGSAR